MTQAEFIARAVGLPWRKWWATWEACDCFGLIVLYFREVRGIDLGEVPQTDIGAGFYAATGWHECGPIPGQTAFMAWRSGAPTHCGLIVDGGMLLHADGTEGRPGNVRLTRLSVMHRQNPDIRFYGYSEASC